MWKSGTIHWKQVPSVEKRYHFYTKGAIKGAENILKGFYKEFRCRKWFPFSTYWCDEWLEIFFCFDFMVHFFAQLYFFVLFFLWEAEIMVHFFYWLRKIFFGSIFRFTFSTELRCYFWSVIFPLVFLDGFREEKGADKMIQKNGTCFLHINPTAEILQNWNGTLFLHF